jgi:hypothetical protein
MRFFAFLGWGVSGYLLFPEDTTMPPRILCPPSCQTVLGQFQGTVMETVYCLGKNGQGIALDMHYSERVVLPVSCQGLFFFLGQMEIMNRQRAAFSCCRGLDWTRRPGADGFGSWELGAYGSQLQRPETLSSEPYWNPALSDQSHGSWQGQQQQWPVSRLLAFHSS